MHRCTCLPQGESNALGRALASVWVATATGGITPSGAGIAGSYLAFAGQGGSHSSKRTRCRAPRRGLPLLLLGVAFGSVIVGMLSDRRSNRRGVLRIYAMLYVASWLPWLLHAQWSRPATLAWFGLMGLLIPGFTLTWTVAKEVNRPEHSGIATAIVNVGIFLGTGILQPLVGAILDRGRAAGDIASAWDTGTGARSSAAFGAWDDPVRARMTPGRRGFRPAPAGSPARAPVCRLGGSSR